MKKRLLGALGSLFMAAGAFCQLGTAPDFTVTDLDGNEIQLYADILDQGKIALVDVSATWCGPCWSLHQSHVLEELHQMYGPNGSDQLRVIFYEGDANTTLADLQGTGGNTLGDWLDGISYPVINESPLSLSMSTWAPQGFPTLNVIRPGDYEIVADPWNVYDLDQQISIIEEGTGIELVEGGGSVGLGEESFGDLEIFPNPAQDQLQVNMTESRGLYTIELINILGSTVFTEQSNVLRNSIDLSSLHSGQYLLRLRTEEGEITKKIQIQR